MPLHALHACTLLQTAHAGQHKPQAPAALPPASQEVDLFRDTPLRFMGYCNEVGESFRYALPSLLVPSYVASYAYGEPLAPSHKRLIHLLHLPHTNASFTSYTSPLLCLPPWALLPVLGDVLNTGMKQVKREGGKVSKTAVCVAVDCCIWQTLASVLIPGFVIHQVVNATKLAIQKAPAGLMSANTARSMLKVR